MHQPRPPKEAFRGHTIVHHGLYKGDSSYFVPVDEHPTHILLKPYALPLIVFIHLPLMWVIEHYVAAHTMIAGVVSCTLYFVIYEYMHWNMHVPRGHYIEKFQWFQFLRNHHHLHHKYHQKNFCVLFPLADWMMGTSETWEGIARKKAEKEAAIERGETPAERRPSSKGSRLRARTQLAMDGALARPISLIESVRLQQNERRVARWKSEREQFRNTKGAAREAFLASREAEK